MSYRDTLEGLVERSSSPARRAYYESELECPPLPAALFYLWKTYRRLANRRGSNGFGANPISWPDIDAFVRNARFPLAPWEIEVIEMLDDLERIEHARTQRARMSTDNKS